MTPLDLIVKNGTILTMDPARRVIADGWVGVRGDTIARVDAADGRLPAATAVVDARGGLILPGLINGHTHAAMSLFRGLADDLPLMEWLNNYIFPAEQRIDAEFVRTGTLLACAEMILCGTTCFCDMYLFEDQVAEAASQAGMRCLVGEVLYDFPSPNYGPVEKGLAYSERLIEKWRGHPLVSIAVGTHAPYTCSPDLLVSTARLASKHEVPLIIHAAETLTEVEIVLDRYGLRPLEFLHSLGLFDNHLIAVHCVHLTEHEMDLMAAAGVHVLFNPQSSMKLASGIAPVPRFMARGINVGLGTDGCASNNNLDLFTEMDTAAKLPKVDLLDPTVMSAETVVAMATIDNARALGLEAAVGSVEVGKKADLIVVDTDKPHLTPAYNPYSLLVYSATGADVSHCIINGRCVMADRRLLTLDLDEVMAAAVEMSLRVRRWLAN